MTDTREQLQAQRAALMARTSTTTLINALRTLDAKGQGLDQHERQARAWTIDELERRYPAASAAVERAFEAAEVEMERTDEIVEVDYVGILTTHIETEMNASV